MVMSLKSGLGIALGVVYIVFGLLSYSYFDLGFPFKQLFTTLLVVYGAFRIYRSAISS